MHGQTYTNNTHTDRQILNMIKIFKKTIWCHFLNTSQVTQIYRYLKKRLERERNWEFRSLKYHTDQQFKLSSSFSPLPQTRKCQVSVTNRKPYLNTTWLSRWPVIGSPRERAERKNMQVKILCRILKHVPVLGFSWELRIKKRADIENGNYKRERELIRKAAIVQTLHVS